MCSAKLLQLSIIWLTKIFNSEIEILTKKGKIRISDNGKKYKSLET